MRRADHRVMKWFGHVESMDEYHMARRVLMAEVSGGQVQHRERLKWDHLTSTSCSCINCFILLQINA